MAAPVQTTEIRATTAGSPPWWRRGTVVAGIAVVILGVELALGWHSLTQALSQLRRPEWSWVAAALVVEMLSMGTFARMQRALLGGAGTKIPIHKHVALAYASHSLSMTLPGGPLFSTTYNFHHMRRLGASSAAASWCIALSGVLSSSTLIIIGSIGGILARSPNGGWRKLVMLAVVTVALAIAVRAIARNPEWLDRPARGLLGGVNRVRRRAPDHGTERVLGFLDQLRSVRLHPRHFALAVALAAGNWLLDATCLWMCCRAIGADRLTLSMLVVAYTAGMAAASLPIVPGGLGVIDGALVLGLCAGGMTSASAVAAVVLYRLISFGFIIGLGWLVWLYVRHRTSPDRYR
jgi:putative heme transporter